MFDQEQTKALAARAREGDAAAFGRLMRSFDHDLRSAVSPIVQSSSAVDEVMQAAYEEAFRTIHTADAGFSLKLWLHTVCHRHAIDYADLASRQSDDDQAPSGTFASLAVVPVSEIRDRDAEPGSAFWPELDRRLIEIEASHAALDATDVDNNATAVEEVGGTDAAPDAAGAGSFFNSRNLMAAAALIAVISLVAVLVNRSSDSSTGDVDVATQAGTTSSSTDGGDEVAGRTETAGDRVATSEPETPLAAIRDRLAGLVPGAGEEGAGSGGPFCFQSDAGRVFPGDDALAQRTIAWLEVSFDGGLNLFAYQAGDVPSMISAGVPGQADGTIDTRFTVESGGAGDSGDLPIYSLTITDDSLTLFEGNTLALVDCNSISAEVDAMFAVITEPEILDLNVAVRILPSEEPVIWRFTSGPVNYRADPGLSTEIIGQWQGDEIGILGTGGRAIGDGYEWVEIAAGEDRQSGWVAQDFIEPDPAFSGRLCYRTGETAMVLEFSEDAETFVGGIRAPGAGSVDPVDFFGVSGRRFEGTMFDARIQDALSAEIQEQEWAAFRDGMSTDLGLLEIANCATMNDAIVDIDAAVTSYPALPASS